eukprot:7633172-Pyramimonas_sp.AAC.1
MHWSKSVVDEMGDDARALSGPHMKDVGACCRNTAGCRCSIHPFLPAARWSPSNCTSANKS